MDDGRGHMVPMNFNAVTPEEQQAIFEKMTALRALRTDLLTAKIEERKQEIEAEHPEHGGWFQVGEIVELKGSRFKVKSIKPNGLYLKLLPRE